MRSLNERRYIKKAKTSFMIVKRKKVTQTKFSYEQYTINVRVELSRVWPQDLSLCLIAARWHSTAPGDDLSQLSLR